MRRPAAYLQGLSEIPTAETLAVTRKSAPFVRKTKRTENKGEFDEVFHYGEKGIKETRYPGL